MKKTKIVYAGLIGTIVISGLFSIYHYHPYWKLSRINLSICAPNEYQLYVGDNEIPKDKLIPLIREVQSLISYQEYALRYPKKTQRIRAARIFDDSYVSNYYINDTEDTALLFNFLTYSTKKSSLIPENHIGQYSATIDICNNKIIEEDYNWVD